MRIRESMGKKCIIVKARHLHKLYIQDLKQVYMRVKPKTPKMPSYYHDDETQSENDSVSSMGEK